MARVLGIGGVFCRSDNPAELADWYKKWLGLEIDSSYMGTSFKLGEMPAKAFTVFAIFDRSTEYFDPSGQEYMINLIVDDLDEALSQVGEGGARITGDIVEEEFGRFGWFIDPDGNKIELWQP